MPSPGQAKIAFDDQHVAEQQSSLEAAHRKRRIRCINGDRGVRRPIRNRRPLARAVRMYPCFMTSCNELDRTLPDRDRDG